MTDPRIISIISFIFALMAAYSLYTGIRQLRDARRAGHPIRWYKHLNLLTGLEYALLTFVFLLRLASAQNAIAPAMMPLVGILYIVLLIPAAIIAGLVIRRVLLNLRTGGPGSRAPARIAATSTATPMETEQEENGLSKQSKEEQAQRQRERRKKAAAARRRQAGKA